MATMNVKDAAGSTTSVEKPNANGRAAASASRPVAISTEDKAALDAVGTALGAPADAAANADTGTFSLIAVAKRIVAKLTSVIALFPAALTGGGGMKVGLVDAIPAGTNAIGKLAANDGVDIGNVDVASLPVAFNAGGAGPTVLRTVTATDSLELEKLDTVISTLDTMQTSLEDLADIKIANENLSAAVVGVAHDAAAGSVNPALMGGYAKALGSNPTGVGDGDAVRAHYLRAGIPFVMGGHPNIIVRSHRIEDADNAQTDLGALTVSGGSRIVITQIHVRAAKTNSGNVRVLVGFGASAVPTPVETGVNDLIIDELLGPGDGHQIGNGSGIIAIGGDGDDLRITCDDPSAGSITVGYSYFTIEG